MPYIGQDRRMEIERYGDDPATVGELNYLVTKSVIAFLGDSPGYTDFNGAIGALEAAKLELYRRMVAPYETEKVAENGDVYDG